MYWTIELDKQLIAGNPLTGCRHHPHLAPAWMHSPQYLALALMHSFPSEKTEDKEGDERERDGERERRTQTETERGERERERGGREGVSERDRDRERGGARQREREERDRERERRRETQREREKSHTRALPQRCLSMQTKRHWTPRSHTLPVYFYMVTLA